MRFWIGTHMPKWLTRYRWVRRMFNMATLEDLERAGVFDRR